MERQPPTRRGRHGTNAESVSVADLLARTTPAEMASVSAIQERAAVEAAVAAEVARERTRTTAQFPAVPPDVTVPVDPAVAAEVPRVSNRLARTIMVLIAAMVTCGAVTVSSVVTTGAPVRHVPSTPTVGPAAISGPTVIRPDLLNEQLKDGLLTVGRRGGSGTLSTGSLRPEDLARAERLIGPGMTGAVSGPQADRLAQWVRNFYLAMETTPERSFRRLGPEMRGDGEASFVRSWNDLLVEVNQVVVGEGGVVWAVVSIAWPDATVLRTEQVLVVNDGPEPVIVRAELVSAHRG